MSNSENSAADGQSQTVCGLIMPISKSDDEHSTSHWENVKDILSEAIAKAGCKPQPVWEGGAHDIIQAKILQNIYENPIVICDLSTRNPNVMLEIGMRLTTKKPTLLVAEEGTSLPFDTGIIHTEFYNPRLEYRTTQVFIERLSVQIKEKLRAYEAGTYHPYLEAFEFETVQPSVVSVSAEERLTDLVSRMTENVASLERTISRGRFVDNALLNWVGRKEISTQPELNSKNALAGYSFDAFAESRMPDKAKVGAKVYHAKFGEGRVVMIEGNKITVDFDNIGQRRVIDSFLDWIVPD